MQSLKIVAVYPQSARALVDALSDFDAQLIETIDGGYEVTVSLGDDEQITGVLNAIEEYVIARARCARISLNGHEYVMHPDPVT